MANNKNNKKRHCSSLIENCWKHDTSCAWCYSRCTETEREIENVIPFSFLTRDTLWLGPKYRHQSENRRARERDGRAPDHIHAARVFSGVLGVNQDEPLRKILIKNNLMIMIITTFDDGHIIHQCVNSSVTAFIHMWRTIPVGFFSLYSTFIEIITRYCYLRMPSFWFR